MADTDTKVPIDLQSVMARMEARQGSRPQAETTAAPIQEQQSIPVPVALEGLLTPPNPYTVLDVLGGMARVKMLSEQYFGMSVSDTCTALQFVINTYNRTSKYKTIDAAVPVPVVPAKPIE